MKEEESRVEATEKASRPPGWNSTLVHARSEAGVVQLARAEASNTVPGDAQSGVRAIKPYPLLEVRM